MMVGEKRWVSTSGCMADWQSPKSCLEVQVPANPLCPWQRRGFALTQALQTAEQPKNVIET